MICPYCSANDDKVIDSRATEAGRVIRRRRQCLNCGKRFTTYERVEQASRLMVVKRDGSRVPFSRDNIAQGIANACGKRPVPEEVKDRIVDEIEEELHQEFEREAPSEVIGERVLAKLRHVDDVSYVRFATEHLRMQSLGEIRREIEDLMDRPRELRNQRPLFQGEGEGASTNAEGRGADAGG